MFDSFLFGKYGLARLEGVKLRKARNEYMLPPIPKHRSIFGCLELALDVSAHTVRFGQLFEVFRKTCARRYNFGPQRIILGAMRQLWSIN